MEFLFYYHYFSGWFLKYIYHFYLFIYFCIIFLHTNLPYFVKRPRAIVIDWALYKYFYYYYYYYYIMTEMPEEQAGFVERNGTSEQIVNITIIIERSVETKICHCTYVCN